MSTITRNIGLSLGADLCWPAAYEELIQRLDLSLKLGEDTVRFAVERVTVEPFNLRYKPKYDIVLDRLTHWFPVSREWIKKIVLMDGVYVLNNPWSVQSMEKHTSYCAMMRLGLPIPETWMIPAKEYDEAAWDTGVTVRRYNKLFQLDKVGDAVGYPCYLKPYDGGGWVGVRRVKNARELLTAYDQSGQRVHHLQQGVEGFDLFIRGIGIGPQVNIVHYDPDAPLHGRYMVDFHFMTGEEWAHASKITRIVNSFFGWDFNSCEMLRRDGTFYPIDYANACPDSQVTSLHFHFPELVKSLLRWSLFCAATKRVRAVNLNWQPYFDIADRTDLTLEQKIDAYDELAKAYFDSDAFSAFCKEHLTELDRVAYDFFGTPRFKAIVKDKVTALYPPHEVERFTDHFFGLVQFWRKTEADRLGVEFK